MGEIAQSARAARALANSLKNAQCLDGHSFPGWTCPWRQWYANDPEDERAFIEQINPDYLCGNCRRAWLAEALAQDLESGALLDFLPPSVRERLVKDATQELQRKPRNDG